jgi:hypothetical protein
MHLHFGPSLKSRLNNSTVILYSASSRCLRRRFCHSGCVHRGDTGTILLHGAGGTMLFMMRLNLAFLPSNQLLRTQFHSAMAFSVVSLASIPSFARRRGQWLRQ